MVNWEEEGEREQAERDREAERRGARQRNQLLSFQPVVTILMYVGSVMYVALLR